MKNAMYKDEIDWIVRNRNRNKFIKNLALSLEGNTLILFQFVDKHGKELLQLFGSPEGKQIAYVDGGVDGELREDVRTLAESNDNVIIIASSGTFSTGVNIKNLHNVIFASPSKSRIRNLQSIGRALRKSDNKTKATLYDIADDLTHKSWKNHTLKHFEQRMRIYGEEKFPYKMYTIQLKE
jgi:superfamily II DNA or RNA helicase